MIMNKTSDELAAKACKALIEFDDYIEAIGLLTQAIHITPYDYRLYTNRSVAFYRMKRYGLALKDTEVAISLNRKCAINYIRQASALNGLHRYKKAEVAATMAIKLNPTSRLAAYELLLSRKRALLSMGFDKQDVMSVVGNCQSIADGFAKLLKITQTKDV